MSGDPYVVGIMGGAIVYGSMYLSGAHFNPAVSMALWLQGNLNSLRFLFYSLFQIIGALGAAFMAFWLTGRTFGPAPAPTVGSWQAFILEGLFAYALVMVYLGLPRRDPEQPHPALGLGVALSLSGTNYLIGPFTGAGVNPALGLGTLWVEAVIGNSHLEYLWIYVAGPVAGALLAVLSAGGRKKKPRETEKISHETILS